MPESGLVFARFEYKMSAALYKEMMGIDDAQPKKTNKGKTLMIFNDQSGSMSGRPFDALQEANRAFADILFPEGEEPAFEDTHLVYWHSSAYGVNCQSKQQFLSHLADTSRGWGGTNFECCFDYMRSKAPKEEGTLAVIFLTDGCGYGDVERLKTFMADLKNRVGVESEIYCLGVSYSHDANFLNRLAKGGSETGNFIYIDTGKQGYKEEIVGNMNDSLGMVMSTGMKARMNLYKGADQKLFDFKQCEVEYEYPEPEEEEED